MWTTRLRWFLLGAAAIWLPACLLGDRITWSPRELLLPRAVAVQPMSLSGLEAANGIALANDPAAATSVAAARIPAGNDGATARTTVDDNCCGEQTAVAAEQEEGKLRIICFGAHPDDCELRAAGTGALWAKQGHQVKFVSVTNGDIGHWQMAGGPLAQRRKAEVERSAAILGIEAQVLDIHDGELLPTLEHRRTITRLIRQWKADVVMCHRPNDYHPDHRNVGLLVQDAAFMVTVPFFCPDTPRLESNPVFLYYEDRFQKPEPFAPDVVVAIDDALQQKLAMVATLESQFFEGGCCTDMKEIPRGAAAEARKKAVHDSFQRRFASTADRFRSRLLHYYGPQQGAAVGYAEAFEICEYGRQPTPAEIRQLFPFFPTEP